MRESEANLRLSWQLEHVLPRCYLPLSCLSRVDLSETDHRAIQVFRNSSRFCVERWRQEAASHLGIRCSLCQTARLMFVLPSVHPVQASDIRAAEFPCRFSNAVQRGMWEESLCCDGDVSSRLEASESASSTLRG